MDLRTLPGDIGASTRSSSDISSQLSDGYSDLADNQSLRSASTGSEYFVYGSSPSILKYTLCEGTYISCTGGKWWWEYNIPYSTMELWQASTTESYRYFVANAATNTIGLGKGLGRNPGSSTVNIIGDIDNDGSKATLRVYKGGSSLLFDSNEIDSTTDLYIQHNSDKDTYINPTGGKVGIGTTSPDYLLDVHGTIRAEEVLVEQFTADYVFGPHYDLMSLDEVEDYIQTNKHLPGMPSAEDTAKQGVSIGEQNALLLQKIEELTLHLIDQKKEIESLKKQLLGKGRM